MESPSDLVVRVVRLQFCQDQECEFSGDLHLLVDWETTKLDSAKTVAVSYTWGEFHRRDVNLGHNVGGKAVVMNLGEEWDTQEVMVALATLCMEQPGRDTCWIDQLCIHQENPEAVRRTISQIPLIYRSLDVVAMMPGIPCKCLEEAMPELQNLDDLADWSTKPGGMEQFFACKSRYETIMFGCVNASAMSTYFSRVWTRQEMMYSKNITVLWTGDEAACVKSIEQVGQLSPFAHRKLLEYESLGIPRETALNMVRNEAGVFLSDCNIAIAEYAGLAYVAGIAGVELYKTVARFLSGQPVLNANPHNDSDTPRQQYERFVEQTGRLGGTNRIATKPHDYIASVWVDCPGYILPKDYRTVGLPVLLEDAVQQFESLSGLAISINLPTSLISGDRDGSVFWKPTRCLGTDVSGTAEVYGIMSAPFVPVPKTDRNLLPLYSFSNKNISMASRAADFQVVFPTMSTADVFDQMKSVVGQWPMSILERVVRRNAGPAGGVIPGSLKEQETLKVFFIGLLLDDAMVKWRRPGASRSWRHLAPDIDHEGAVYTLVAMALNVDVALCRRNNLRLVLSLQHPPCIGLTNRDPNTFYELHNSDRIYREDPGTTVTVCVNKGTMTTGDTLFDAGKVGEEDGIPQYRFHTVWVPQHSTAFHDVNAVVDAKARDGFIMC